MIEEAIEIATSDAFMPPISPEVRHQIQSAFTRAVTVLGPKAAQELFVSLGPTDTLRVQRPAGDAAAGR